MASTNSQTVPKLLRNLRDNGKIVLQCGALTYIRSNAEKLELSSAMTDTEYAEICRLIMDIATGGDQNTRNEATKALHAILKHFRKHSLKFFESAISIDRDKRCRIFQFLETVDDNSFLVTVGDPLLSKFLANCLVSVNQNSMPWLSPTLDIKKLEELEQENKAKESSDNEELIVDYALNILSRIYKTGAFSTDSQTIVKLDLIVMEKAIPLAYLGYKRQRKAAIDLLNQAIEANMPKRVKSVLVDLYSNFKKNIQESYTQRMMLLLTACEPDWSNLWSISFQILGTDLHQKAPLMNKLLSVEEKAFKSTNITIRREAFVCWKLLIDNQALDMKELAKQRRVKLLCLPLIASNSQSEVIALKKLEVWWYLISKLYPNITPFTDPVVTQFLNFCFGPLGDTPLSTTKKEAIVSPGKRFNKSKIMAIDALSQLLVTNQKEQRIIVNVLEQRLPSAISEGLFKQCYKYFLLSVIEAVLIISKFDDTEIENREEICKLLWTSLMQYIRTSDELKTTILTELIHAIHELQIHSSESDFINNFFRDIVIPTLSTFSQDLIYHDYTLIDLMTQVMTPRYLKNLQTRQCEAVKILIWQAVKPETDYHPETLNFLDTTLSQLRMIPVDTEASIDLWFVSFELWYVYADIIHKYMKELNDVNEGSEKKTNFKTIEAILTFPFSHMYWANSFQAQKIAAHWKDIYKKYECQADTMPHTKPNEIVEKTSKMIETYLAKNEKSFRIAIYCLDALVGTINYKVLLADTKIPTIVKLVGDLAAISIHKNQVAEAECALKTFSSLLITVYGHHPEKAPTYMAVTSSTVELMLKTDVDDALSKEVLSTWETIVSILRGLGNTLTEVFLKSYKNIITSALRHPNPKIVAQARSIIEIQDSMKANAKSFLVELFEEHKKITGKDFVKGKLEKGERTPKTTRVAGSFMHRATASPRPIARKDEEEKKLAIASTDSNSQDYVVIKSNMKLDVNCLTEHQKEMFKKRRDDIPALYNDLSQSSSQDSQDLQKWFVNKTKSDETEKLTEEAKKINTEVVNSQATKMTKISQLNSQDDKITKLDEPESSRKEKIMETQEDSVSKDSQNSQEVASSGQNPNISPAQLSVVLEDALKSTENLNEKLSTESNSDPSDSIPGSTDRRTKRKASPVENEQELTEKKRKKSDKAPSNEEQLSEFHRRTKLEISRLRIDMVLDGPVTSRRRSKTNDETPQKSSDHNKNLRGKEPKNLKTTSKVADDQKVIKKNRKRVGKLEDEKVKKKRDNESNENSQVTKSLRGRVLKKIAKETGNPSESQIITDDETLNDESSKVESQMSEDGESQPNVEKMEEKMPLDETGVDRVENPENETQTDLDEIVESSQDTAVLTGSYKRSFGKIIKLKSMDEIKSKDLAADSDQPTTSSPIVILEKPDQTNSLKENAPEDQDETFLDISAIRPQIADPVPVEEEKKMPEASQTTVSPVSIKSTEANINFSSPKGQKRLSKFKNFAPQGRAAHMLGLVTKLANLEKDGQVDKNEVEEEIAKIKRTRTKETNDGDSLKRDRTNVIREPEKLERIGSPGGSRQEKIFNNMKTGEYAASPPSKLFSNLKNNGERISPKLEKFQGSQENGVPESKGDEISISSEKDELPILEWSSANPPSMTASPSASILKRNRSLGNEIEADGATTLGRSRKRVSFADPPVSKEMGYEVETGNSPHKIKCGKMPFARKDSPIRIKQSRFVMIQMEPDKAEKQNEQQASNSDVDLNCDKDNQLLMNIAGDLEQLVEFRASENNEILNVSSEVVIESQEDEQQLKKVSKISRELEVMSDKDPQIEEAATQDDLFNSSDEKSESPAIMPISTKIRMLKNLSSYGHDVSVESVKLNVTDDSAIGNVTDVPAEEANSQMNLEDTIDVRNVPSLNSTVNSEEAFGEVPVKTSTQVPDSICEMDTLPVTNSILTIQDSQTAQEDKIVQPELSNSICEMDTLPVINSLPTTQDSQGTQEVKIARPELLNSTEAIYPSLEECTRPIELIIDNLTNPLWKKNLFKYLETRGIRTIGDLARLSEREVIRIPVKGSSRIDFVKNVLRKFEQNLKDCPKDKKVSNEPGVTKSENTVPEFREKNKLVENELHELPQKIRNTLGDISALAGISKIPELASTLDAEELGESQAPVDFPSSYQLDELPLPTRTSTANSISTIVIDSSSEREMSGLNDSTISQMGTVNLCSTILPNFRTVGTGTDVQVENKSVETEAKIEDILDAIDVDVLLNNVMKRTNLEKFLIKYKQQVPKVSETDLCAETLRILGIKNDTLLQLACRECGLEKTLRELPNIFFNSQNSNS